MADIRLLLDKKFVSAYYHAEKDLVILETEDGELVEIEAQSLKGHGILDVTGLDAFDDADFHKYEPLK